MSNNLVNYNGKINSLILWIYAKFAVICNVTGAGFQREEVKEAQYFTTKLEGIEKIAVISLFPTKQDGFLCHFFKKN